MPKKLGSLGSKKATTSATVRHSLMTYRLETRCLFSFGNILIHCGHSSAFPAHGNGPLLSLRIISRCLRFPGTRYRPTVSYNCLTPDTDGERRTWHKSHSESSYAGPPSSHIKTRRTNKHMRLERHGGHYLQLLRGKLCRHFPIRAHVAILLDTATILPAAGVDHGGFTRCVSIRSARLVLVRTDSSPTHRQSRD